MAVMLVCRGLVRACARALAFRMPLLVRRQTGQQREVVPAMYATCLFCNRPLGSNESIEHFPVGRRLAFDSTKGRLWAVCPACERWNLTPLEERWEAIEDAERLYRSTRLRAATDQIGLARLRDGTELVRIGEPLRQRRRRDAPCQRAHGR